MVELGGGGASPATLEGRSRTEELQWGEAKLVEGSIWGGMGRTVPPRASREGAALMAPTVVLGRSDGAGKETTGLGASAIARERGVAVDFGNVGAER